MDVLPAQMNSYTRIATIQGEFDLFGWLLENISWPSRVTNKCSNFTKAYLKSRIPFYISKIYIRKFVIVHGGLSFLIICWCCIYHIWYWLAPPLCPWLHSASLDSKLSKAYSEGFIVLSKDEPFGTLINKKLLVSYMIRWLELCLNFLHHTNP